MITEVNEYLADDKKVLVTFLMDKELLERAEQFKLDAEKNLTDIFGPMTIASIAYVLSRETQEKLAKDYMEMIGVKT